MPEFIFVRYVQKKVIAGFASPIVPQGLIQCTNDKSSVNGLMLHYNLWPQEHELPILTPGPYNING